MRAGKSSPPSPQAFSFSLASESAQADWALNTLLDDPGPRGGSQVSVEVAVEVAANVVISRDLLALFRGGKGELSWRRHDWRRVGAVATQAFDQFVGPQSLRGPAAQQESEGEATHVGVFAGCERLFDRAEL